MKRLSSRTSLLTSCSDALALFRQSRVAQFSSLSSPTSVSALRCPVSQQKLGAYHRLTGHDQSRLLHSILPRQFSHSKMAMEPPPPPQVTLHGDLVEAAKQAAGRQAVKDHLLPSYTHIGIGSGSTIKYVVEAIAELPSDITSKMKFVPTGIQSRDLIRVAKLPLLAIDDLVLERPYVEGQQYLDVCFDGADEVDLELNCIKGGGACHYQEKLVAKFSKKFICVADYRKKVDRLLTNWVAVPIEVQPLATEAVRRELITIGSRKPFIRSGLPGKAGPIVTDNGNHVIDAPFPPLLLNSEHDKQDVSKGLWTVDALAARLKSITGVLEIGIFSGPDGPTAAGLGKGGEKPIMVYFGLEDGSIETREGKR